MEDVGYISYMDGERRRNQRIDIELPVVLRYAGYLKPATMLNLSCGGAYVRTGRLSVSANTPVEIIFDLDNEKNLSAMARIRRLETGETDSQLGLQFTDIFSECHNAVQEYLGKHLN